MKAIYFLLGEISIQVIPSADLCVIFKNGKPMWAGDREDLIEILESVHGNELNEKK